MPTVVVRFETCKKAIGYGTVYYRIYKGHNRRMEFLPTFTYQLLLGMKPQDNPGEHPKACLFVLRWKRIFGF
ncbi:hypothetical protein [Phocaeicola vulgatus]|uniref:hypothetical protein n=1 Tax=Phocaeicola vulgatus TaxID=821 RepID=UPI00211ED179|nr:hypothetical protein [Phocaeicola vulgatus]